MAPHRRTGPFLPASLVGCLFATLWTPSPVRAEELKRYEDQKIVRVDVKTPAQLRALEDTGATILDCVPGAGPMTVLATPEQLSDIERLGLTTHMLQERVQAWVDTQRVAAARGDPFDDFFLDYHEYGDAGTAGTIVWYMNELVSRFPDLVSLFNLGSTIQGRTIWGMHITNDGVADKPAVVYFGGEHAREWITTTLPTYFATYLLENYAADARVTDLIDNVEFFLIPVFNVDGYAYSWAADRFWRKNRRRNSDGSYGVDLNRNWATGWGGIGSSGRTTSLTYRGVLAFSEPETRALRDFFRDHANVRAQLDIHAYTQLILWPYGYTPALSADQDVYEEVGTAMQSLILDVHGMSYEAGPTYTTIYPASGISGDWTYSRLGILSYSFECRDKGFYGFLLPADQIIPNNEELLPAMLHLSDSDWVRSAIRFTFQGGIPATITPGIDTTITLELIEQFESVAPGSARLHYRYDTSGPFIEVPLTPTGGESYSAVLPATNCLSTPQFYFSVLGDGGTTVTSPRQAPAEAVYTAGVTTGAEVVLDEDLSVDPGWATQGAWAWGQPLGLGGEYGGPDPTGGHTGSRVYGYNLLGDYTANMPQRHLTSTPIDCSGLFAVHLKFRRWLGVEQSAYDHAFVRVSNDGINWVTVWQNNAQIVDRAWTLQDIDISAVADDQPMVFLRWTMGPTDAGRQYCGWNLDDIQITAGVCEGVAGDYNGDGRIDADDYARFEQCFSGESNAIQPGCGIFDFDGDGNVDCDDWFAFRSAWTGAGDAPAFAVCEVFSAPIADPFAKNRYIAFTPRGARGMLQAFRVTTMSNPLFPNTVGDQKWVGPMDDRRASRLQCSPAYEDWGFERVDVGDQDIVPGATYTVEATLDGADFLEGVIVTTVPMWGDVVGVFADGAWTSPNGLVNILDATAAIDVFRSSSTAPPLTWCDVYPAVPDGSIDVPDIVHVLDAFRALPYPFAEPEGCP
jgi:hypothetical protein